MNYVNNDNLYKLLAAEYVLGTLTGQARVRFKKLMMEYPQVSQAVWDWERYLSTMNDKLLPVEPSAALYQKIEAKLFNDASVDATPVAPISLPRKRPERSRPLFSVYTGLAAMIAVLVTAFLIYQRPAVGPVEDRTVSVVQNKEAKSLWIIEIEQQAIVVKATANVEQRNDKDYQLWMVPKQGDAPVSLGVLPKKGQLRLPRVSGFDITNLAALAVSLEPLGGSPNGLPTEVLFVTDTVLLPAT